MALTSGTEVMGGIYDEVGLGITVDYGNQIFFIGRYEGTGKFGRNVETSAGEDDLLVGKYVE